MTLTDADKKKWAGHKKAVRKAERSVEVLARFIEKADEPLYLKRSAQLEINRLQAALNDLNLLRTIFARGSKS